MANLREWIILACLDVSNSVIQILVIVYNTFISLHFYFTNRTFYGNPKFLPSFLLVFAILVVNACIGQIQTVRSLIMARIKNATTEILDEIKNTWKHWIGATCVLSIVWCFLAMMTYSAYGFPLDFIGIMVGGIATCRIIGIWGFHKMRVEEETSRLPTINVEAPSETHENSTEF